MIMNILLVIIALEAVSGFDTSKFVTYIKAVPGQDPPEGAIAGGHDGGPSYHARACCVGDELTIPGKVGVRYTDNKTAKLITAAIPWGGSENRRREFEILTLNWPYGYETHKTGDAVPEFAVQGGYDGGASYFARGKIDGKTIPGKVGVRSDTDNHFVGACIPYAGENRMQEFEVLVLKPIQRIVSSAWKTVQSPLTFDTEFQYMAQIESIYPDGKKTIEMQEGVLKPKGRQDVAGAAAA